MNRGFNYYFREGVKSSCKALYKDNKGLLRFIIYFFMELLGRLLIVFNLLFGLSNVKQGELIWKRERVDVCQSFKTAGNPRALWTYFLTLSVEALMFLAGVIIIGIITLALAAIGYAISIIAPEIQPALLMMIFAIPGGILLEVYIVIMALIFSPTAYIVATNEGIGVGDTLSACFNTMKSQGKGTLFLGVFVTCLIESAIVLILAGITVAIAALSAGQPVLIIVLVLWALIALAGLALTLPIFALTRRSLIHHLFNDIAIDPISKNKNTYGINITHCNGKKFIANPDDKLVAMFDRTGNTAANNTAADNKQTVDLSRAFQNDEFARRSKAKPPVSEAQKLFDSLTEQTQQPAEKKQVKSFEIADEEEVPTVGGEIKAASSAEVQPEVKSTVKSVEEEEEIPTVGGEAQAAEEEEVPTVGGEVKAAAEEKKPEVKEEIKNPEPQEVPAAEKPKEQEKAEPEKPAEPVKPAEPDIEEKPAEEAQPKKRTTKKAAPAVEKTEAAEQPAKPDEAEKPPVKSSKPTDKPSAKPVKKAEEEPKPKAKPVVRVLQSADSEDDGFNDALPEGRHHKNDLDDDGFNDPVSAPSKRPGFAADSDEDDGFDDEF